MKRSTLICIINLFVVINLFSLTTYEEFEKLPMQQKIDTIISEYENEIWLGLGFAIKSETIYQHTTEALLYIVSLLEKHEAKPVGTSDNVVYILNQLVFDFYQEDKYNNEKIVTDSIKEILAKNYERLIDAYLNTYKLIDSMLVTLDLCYIRYAGISMPETSFQWYVSLYDKYTSRGYKELKINYDELKKR